MIEKRSLYEFELSINWTIRIIPAIFRCIIEILVYL